MKRVASTIVIALFAGDARAEGVCGTDRDCPGAEVCDNGRCSGRGGKAPEMPVSCNNDDDCPASAICEDEGCVPGKKAKVAAEIIADVGAGAVDKSDFVTVYGARALVGAYDGKTIMGGALGYQQFSGVGLLRLGFGVSKMRSAFYAEYQLGALATATSNMNVGVFFGLGFGFNIARVVRLGGYLETAYVSKVPVYTFSIPLGVRF